MKSKTLAVVFGSILVSLGVTASVSSQQPGERREEALTKFEQFLLSKGTVRVREFYPILGLKGTLGEATFQVARAYTPGKEDYILALRVEVKESGRLQRERVGVLDEEEVASLAEALPKMAKMQELLTRGTGGQNTEVDFKGGSLRIGFYVAPLRSHWFVHAGEIGGATAYFDPSDFSKLQDTISRAVAKIRELRQKP